MRKFVIEFNIWPFVSTIQSERPLIAAKLSYISSFNKICGQVENICCTVDRKIFVHGRLKGLSLIA